MEIRAIVKADQEAERPTPGDFSRARHACYEANRELARLEMVQVRREEFLLEKKRLEKEVGKRLLFLTERIRCGRKLRNLMPGAPVDDSTNPSPR